MQCARYRESIHELVDGTIGPIRRAELEQHLDTCGECRAFAGDLQIIHDTAASLDNLAPPDGVWLQVAGRLRQEGRVAALPAATRRRSAHRSGVLLAIAAALVLAVGTSLLLLVRDDVPASQGTVAGTTAGNAGDQDAVQGIAEEIQLAEQHYQNAITRLEQVAKLDATTGETTIDPQTAATLQKSLGVIDQAIAESRAALRTEPQSAPARDSLFDALRRKVVLLQDTVVLINEMRKGNSAGAAQIVDGLNKS
jgi:anti-sigma factor RsiW